MAVFAAIASLDFTTIATNASVLVATAGSAGYAVWKAAKKAKSLFPDEQPSSQKIIGATILENVTLLMWSESNRDVVEALREHAADLRENTKEMMELRHKIDIIHAAGIKLT